MPDTAPSPRGRVGRPPRTSLDRILDAVEQLGLASFTISDLADRLGVREATLYNYVGGRDEAYRSASARLLGRLDTSVPDADGWPEYVETVCERGFDLVRAHPGIEPYVRSGPYLPESVQVFVAIIDEVLARLPDATEDTAYAVAAPPFLLSVSMANNDYTAPLTRWIRQSMIEGMANRLSRGEEVPQISWRRLLPMAPGSAG